MYQRTYAEIDLDALQHNVGSILNKISGRAKLLCVIKADAYGHGAVEVGKFLSDKCGFFGVACIEEAIELIRNGITKPILILGYVSPHVYETIVKEDIRIPVFSYEMAKALSDEALRQNKTVRFHFCVDTGMSRIGFQATQESADVCKEICSMPNIEAEGIFSHFATADEADLTKAKAQQALFKTFISYLEKHGINIPIKHMNNSAGIMNFDEMFDMVRAGITLYGLYPSYDVDKQLLDIKPVMRWITHVSHLKTLEAGREISYGGTYKTTEERRVATIPVGYADGYPRCLSNIGRVIINNQYAPILGRVCMDQFMVDVTEIEGVEIETPVTLVGEGLSMEDVSEAAHSFNYELPCRLTRRVPRIYYQNGKRVKTYNNLLD